MHIKYIICTLCAVKLHTIGIEVKIKKKKMKLDRSLHTGFNYPMGIVERKLREKEQRIQEILNAARILFINKGYSNTTMLDIAQESELSRRTIYLYFKSKEEISYHVMNDAYALLLHRLQISVEGIDKNAYSRMKRLCDAYLDFYRNDFDQLVFTLLFDYRVKPEDTTDGEARECLKTIHSITRLIVGIMKDGQEDGSLIRVDNPLKTAFTYMTMIQSTLQKLAVRKNWIAVKYDLTGREIMEEMFRIMLFSIADPTYSD